jgi:hypothetical protein
MNKNIPRILIFFIVLFIAVNVSFAQFKLPRYLWQTFIDFIQKFAQKIISQIYEEPEVSLQKQGFVYILNGNPSGIERYGNYVYMVLNETVKSPLVYDISQPDKPKLVNMVPAQGWPTRIRMVEGTKWLWVVHGNTWAFYDLTDPANPRLAEANEGPNIKFVPRGSDNPPTSFAQHPNMTYSSVANENTLFYGRSQTLSDNTTKLWIEIYDISNPTSPKLLSKIDNATPRKLRGNLLLAFGVPPTSPRVQIYDVSNPSNPILISKIDDVPDEIKSLGFGFDDHIDYDANKKILTIGIKRSVPKPYWGANLTDSRMGGTVSGIAVYDVSNWNSPKLLGFGYAGAGEKEYLINMDEHVYANGFVYGADTLGHLVVFDVRDPKNIRKVYEDKQGGELCASAVVPNRNLLLITSSLWSAGALYIVDYSDPATPKVLGNVPHVGMQWATTFGVYKDRYVYFPVGARYIGSPLYIVDIQDPSSPQILNVLWDYGGYNDVIVVDDYLYHSGGAIFSLKENPAAPKKLNVSLPASGNALRFREPYLFLVNPYGTSTLYIIDISNRENPQLVSTVKFSGADARVTSIALIGNYVFVGGNSVRAVDISDIRNPKIVGEWGSTDLNILAEQKQVWSDGKYLYIGTYHSEVSVFDISTIPTLGKPKQIYKLTGLPTAWTINGDASKNLLFRIALYGVSTIKINYMGVASDTTPPPTPQNVKAELINSQIKITWDKVVADDLLEYIIYRSKNAGNFVSYQALPSTTNFFIDIAVEPSSTYSYKVAARDTSFNISPLSSETQPIHIPEPPKNEPPIAQDISTTTNEDTPVSITLSATDKEGDPITFLIDRPPSYGTITGELPNIIYTPNKDYYGEDEFTYKAFDGISYSTSAKVRIKINPVNDPPEKPMVVLPLNNSTVTPNPLIVFRSKDVDSKKLVYIITLEKDNIKKQFTKYALANVTTSFAVPTTDSLTEGEWTIKIKANDNIDISEEAIIKVYVKTNYNLPPKKPSIIFPYKNFMRMPFLLIIASSSDPDSPDIFYRISVSKLNLDYNQFTKEGVNTIYSYKTDFYKSGEYAYFAAFLPVGRYRILIYASDKFSESEPAEIFVNITPLWY